MTTPATTLIQNLDASQLEALIATASLPVLVDFWAPWCGPCKALAPALEALAARMEGRLQVVKVNLDAEPEAAERHLVAAVPTLLLAKGGRIQERAVGSRSLSALEAWLRPCRLSAASRERQPGRSSSPASVTLPPGVRPKRRPPCPDDGASGPCRTAIPGPPSHRHASRRDGGSARPPGRSTEVPNISGQYSGRASVYRGRRRMPWIPP